MERQSDTATETAREAQSAQKPSIGRIVLYNHAAIKVRGPGPDGSVEITQSPATVQLVNPNGTLRLAVMGPHPHAGNGGYEVLPSVQEWKSSDPKDLPSAGTWMWPPRV